MLPGWRTGPAAQQDAGQDGAWVVVGDSARLQGHVFRFKAQVGQLASGAGRQSARTRWSSQSTRRLLVRASMAPASLLASGMAATNSARLLAYKALCFGMAEPLELFSLCHFLSLSLLWPGETRADGSI